jgi:hypothetical protein
MCEREQRQQEKEKRENHSVAFRAVFVCQD